jgi:signal peptidase I
MGARPKGDAMARPPASSDEDADDPEVDEEEEEEAPPRTRRRPPPKPTPRGRPRPIRKWSRDSTAPDDEMEGEDEEATMPGARRPRVFWRARDSLYFGPLVALAIVILLIVCMFAYTQNWPPVYVVESMSMQHGSSDVLGVINTGDLVLAQKVSNSSIQPYVVAQRNGYSTYGEFGDVLLYYPDGAVGTPVIHRAIVYLQWVPSVRGYTAYGLAGLPCGNAPDAVYSTPGTNGSQGANCVTDDLTGTLDLFHVGWADVNVSIQLQPAYLGAHSGYVTMGDNNFNAAYGGEYDQSAEFQLSELVEPAWVIGVARGMIPWVGALKLWIEGSSTAGEVPAQSWQFLGLTFAGIILLAFGLHYALKAEGVEDPRRKAEEEEESEDEAEETEGSAARARHFLRSLRPWGSGSEEEEDEDEEDETPPHRTHRPTHKPAPKPEPSHRRGRPKPKVRRGSKAKRSSDDDDDNL